MYYFFLIVLFKNCEEIEIFFLYLIDIINYVCFDYVEN